MPQPRDETTNLLPASVLSEAGPRQGARGLGTEAATASVTHRHTLRGN